MKTFIVLSTYWITLFEHLHLLRLVIKNNSSIRSFQKHSTLIIKYEHKKTCGKYRGYKINQHKLLAFICLMQTIISVCKNNSFRLNINIV